MLHVLFFTALKPLLFVSVWILILPFCFFSRLSTSLLWKFLLAHPLDLFGSPLSQYVSRSCRRAAIFRYVSGETTSERERGRAYRLHANWSGGFSFKHSQSGLRAQRRRQSPLFKAGIPSQTYWCDEKSTTLMSMEPLHPVMWIILSDLGEFHFIRV